MTRIVPLDSSHPDYTRINNLEKHEYNKEMLLKYLTSSINQVYTDETKEALRVALTEPEQKFITLTGDEQWPLDPVTQRLILPIASYKELCPLLKENFTELETSRSKEDSGYTGRSLLANIKYVVISKNPADLMMCSTGQMFTSCSALNSSYSYSTGIPATILQDNMYIVYGVSNMKHKKWTGHGTALSLYSLKYTFRTFMFEVERQTIEPQEGSPNLPGIDYLKSVLGNKNNNRCEAGGIELCSRELLEGIASMPMASPYLPEYAVPLKELCIKFRAKIRRGCIDAANVPPLRTKLLSNLFMTIINRCLILPNTEPKYVTTRMYNPSMLLAGSGNNSHMLIPERELLLSGSNNSECSRSDSTQIDLAYFFRAKGCPIVTFKGVSGRLKIKGELKYIKTKAGERAISYIDHTAGVTSSTWCISRYSKVTSTLSSHSFNAIGGRRDSSFLGFVEALERYARTSRGANATAIDEIGAQSNCPSREMGAGSWPSEPAIASNRLSFNDGTNSFITIGELKT